MKEEQITTFLLETARLKRMPRSGWIYSGVSPTQVESVADHSYLTSIISLLIALDERNKGKQVDLGKVLVMSLLHDLSEGVSQDIDRRVRKYAPEEFDAFKPKMDKKATEKILDYLPEILAKELNKHSKEFLAGETLEAQIVNQADRLEILVQLAIYEQLGYPKTMFKEFYSSFPAEMADYELELARKLAEELLK